tara:strand:- start:159 stop:1076 length:918 start_codon:yes stop_codon:yes gene_type:complete
MKKPFIFLFLIFAFISNAFSKTLDLEITTLEVPNKYYLVNWEQSDFANDMFKDFSSCHGIVDKKIFEIVEKLNSGVSIDELQILKPLISKYQKVMLSDKNFERETKGLIKMFKSTLNKNKSGTIFNFCSTDEDVGKYDLLNKYDVDIDEIKNMTKSELKKITKKIKNKITSGKNYFMLMDGMFINFDKFIIDKNSNNIPYLIFNGDITYIIGSSKISLGNVVYYISELDNKLIFLDGYCVVKCSNFFSTFDGIVKKSFNQNSLSDNTSNSGDSNFVNQLEQLNELYKSGVLSKEEFEKAKKKILN